MAFSENTSESHFLHLISISKKCACTICRKELVDIEEAYRKKFPSKEDKISKT